MTKVKNSVKKRLIRHVLAISSLIVVIITAFETYVAYQNNLSHSDQVDNQIREVLLPPLVKSVWQFDRESVVSQMGQILSQLNIELVRLGFEGGETIEIGLIKSKKVKTFTYDLVYQLNDDAIDIGSLSVNYGLDSLYQQARLQAVTNIIGNSIMVFFVSFLVVLLARNYITRHLVDIANTLTTSQPNEEGEKILVLNRKKSIHNSGDELEKVVDAINEMQVDLVKSYAEIHDSQERLSQIADNSLMWIWEIDRAGLYTYCSDTCEQLLGYTAKDIVGQKHFYDFFHPDDKEKLKKSAFKFFEKQQYFKEFENRNVNRVGDVVWLFSSGVPIINNAGHLLGYRGADIDITEKKKLMEEQARSSQLAALGTVAAGVAHEINNPIQGIMNYASLIKRSPDREMRNSEIAGKIISESKRIAKITQDLLYYSKDNRIEKRAVDIKETIESALSLISTKTRNRDIDVVAHIPDDLPKAHWQPQSIQQVMLNLIDNAYDALRAKQHSSEQKKIIVSAKLINTKNFPKITIEVQDNGIGMSEDVIRKAQEAFFTTKPPAEGTGLGLSIVNDIVSKHDGTIAIDSKEGQYSRFTVVLPLS